MARPLRIERAGAWYHLTARGNERRPIFWKEIRDRIQRLRGYRWSSYRAYAGFESVPAWIESRPVLGRTGPCAEREQRIWYRQYVEQAVREGLAECPWESLAAQVALGSAEFVRLLRSNLRGDAKEQPSLRALARDVIWERVVLALERVRGEAWSDFRDRHGDWGRDLVLYVARRRAGLTLKGLGQAVGGLDYRSVGWAVQRMEERLQDDRFLKQRLKELDAHIQNPETCPLASCWGRSTSRTMGRSAGMPLRAGLRSALARVGVAGALVGVAGAGTGATGVNPASSSCSWAGSSPSFLEVPKTRRTRASTF